VRLPVDSDAGSVRATAPSIENLEVTFTVSALEELRLESRSISTPFDAAPIALAAGIIDGDGVDLIAVGSAGGETRALVLHRPLANPVALPVPATLGTSPADVAVLGNQIAILNARRSGGEAAEVRTLRFAAGAIELDDLYVLTASNAIALAPLGRFGSETALAVATTGRSTNDQPCAPNTCGECPAGEACGDDGLCIAHDGAIVVLAPDPARPGKLIEQNRCEEPVSECATGGCCIGDVIACDRDDCGCDVPRRARLGSYRGPLDPRAVAAAPLVSASSSDLLVATQAGLHRLDEAASGFDGGDAFVLSSNVIAAVGGGIDTELDTNADAAWIEDAPCASGLSIDTLCPITAPAADARGCLGLLLTEQSGAVPELSPPALGSCRRHPLPFVPTAICLAQLDDAGQPDLVVSSDGLVHVFAGDDRGGLLDPPQSLEAPTGPMVCADLDGDGLDEVVVADRAQPGRFQVLSF
jgi:hypothetical protein